jgi:hypothetical protein
VYCPAGLVDGGVGKIETGRQYIAELPYKNYELDKFDLNSLRIPIINS